MPPIARYDGLADWYDAFVHGEGREWTARVEVLLRPLLGAGRGRCLDLGCGTGAFLPLIAELGWSPVGVDVSADQLRVARASAGDLVDDLVQADAAALPFADGTFDAVASLMIHTDVDDYAAVLREAARVLRPGGALVHVGVHPCFLGPFARVHPDGSRTILPGYGSTERIFDSPAFRKADGLRARVGVVEPHARGALQRARRGRAGARARRRGRRRPARPAGPARRPRLTP